MRFKLADDLKLRPILRYLLSQFITCLKHFINTYRCVCWMKSTSIDGLDVPYIRPWLLIHIDEIFNWRVTFRCRCQCALSLLRKNFQHSYNQAKEVLLFLIQLLSYTVVSKQKIKMKAQKTMAPSYHSKVTPTQNKVVPFFSCLAHGLSQRFPDIFSLPV